MLRYLVVFIASFCAIHAFQDVSVLQCLVDNGYNSMTSLLRTAGLDTLLSTSGPFTVFAPTDDVFHKLGPGMLASLHSNTAELKRIMQYHVVKEFLLLPVINAYTSVPTLLYGQYLTLHKVSATDVVLNNGTRIVPPTDIICNNGVIQTIQGLLAVPAAAADMRIDQILIRDDRFRIFAVELLDTGLLHILQGGEYTVFVPTNAAFAELGNAFSDPDAPRPSTTEIIEMMKYYMIPGERTLETLRNGQDVYSLNGQYINVTITSTGDVMINDARVIDTDIMAINGVIHVIDHLIEAASN